MPEYDTLSQGVCDQQGNETEEEVAGQRKKVIITFTHILGW